MLDTAATQMVTQFITVEIDLKDLSIPLQNAIEAALQIQGEPLRWAVTAVHDDIAQVEAVVLQNIEA
jgi:hypothetical protein